MRAIAGAVFDGKDIFNALYWLAFRPVSKTRGVALEETHDVFSQSGLANLVGDYLARYFGRLVDGRTAAYIHRDGLACFQDP
jgi:hypothetical protein